MVLDQATSFQDRRTPRTRPIGIIGPPGSHSHEIFLQQFPENEYRMVFVTKPSGKTPFRELIECIRDGRATCSFVPFYNTRKAYFNGVPGHILRNRLFVVDFRANRVRQRLITTKEVRSLSEIKGVLTNEQCLEQSKDWLIKNLPHITPNDAFPSSSEAARVVCKLNKKNDHKKYAVVGAELLTKLPGLNLKVLVRSVEKGNEKGHKKAPNVTSFFVVSKRGRRFEGNPYALYSFPLGSEVLLEKKWIRSRIAREGFWISAMWLGKKPNGDPAQYLFHIHTGEDSKRIEKFEADMRKRYGKRFRLMGRLSKDVPVKQDDNLVK